MCVNICSDLDVVLPWLSSTHGTREYYGGVRTMYVTVDRVQFYQFLLMRQQKVVEATLNFYKNGKPHKHTHT